ncbi:neutral zinc metallopeptidase [Aestuariimicrobium soli]|uniref:neutral zinc metallopeptidase n=1 Tax=Aestuariimicrobium soli TaxID=2035834 RepID=UPI003EB89870
MLVVVSNTLALVVVVALALVGWGWLKDDLAGFGGPVAVESPTPTGPNPTAPTPTATQPSATTQPSVTTQPSTSKPTTNKPSAKPTPAPPAVTNAPPATVPRVDWGPLPKPTATDSWGWLLQQGPLNAQKIPTATCPRLPDPIPSGPAFRALANKLVDCELARWTKPVADSGHTLERPAVTFFNGTVNSECGNVRNSQVSFYCGAGTGTIYVHTRVTRESNEGWRLRLAETIVHEFFHHVQATTGILEARYRVVQAGMNDDEASRRTELQALCVSTRILATTPAWGFTRQDYNLIAYSLRHTPQDAQHGSTTSNDYWGRRGFSMVLVGGCNTWTVPASRVS